MAYENIDQPMLLAQLAAQVRDNGLLGLLGQAIERSVERGGLWRDIRTGISRGCPLSPLLGILFLKILDDRFGNRAVFYGRYIDDVLVLTRTHGQLRGAVRTLNQIVNRLKLAQAPDKTFIGRIARGFDFLGHQFFQHAPAAGRKDIHETRGTVASALRATDTKNGSRRCRRSGCLCV